MGMVQKSSRNAHIRLRYSACNGKICTYQEADQKYERVIRMEQSVRRDIFISYKNDGSGNQFANRLCKDLEDAGYSVYFNSNEERTQNFPDRLKNAIQGCNDFILILSKGCMEQLISHNSIDWVREEVLTAYHEGKHIIPILMDDVELPRNAADMPEDLQFLPHIDALKFPEQYLTSPFSVLLGVLRSRKNSTSKYRDTFNSNPLYDVKCDFVNLLQLANNGDIEAMYEVGMMYYYGVTDTEGTVSRHDYEQAASWLKKVAESDSDLRFHACNIIARLYYEGGMPREPQSYELAYQYHKVAGEKDAHSAITQGHMQRAGLGCEYDYYAVVNFYQENIQRGDDESRMALAHFYVQYGRFEEAIKLYDSITMMSPEADYQIGLLYLNGVLEDPPKPDYIQAAYYFRNAADCNHIQAAYEYGRICLKPCGRFRKNFPNAQKYLQIAADNGIADAQYLLGFMFCAGHVTKSVEKAVEYYEKARQQGHSYAALDLSKIYQEPEFQNYRRAYECARIAASHGVAEGELILGNLLFFGRGCEADMNKAYEMYTRAYKHGMYYASVMMRKIENILQGK